MKLEFSRDDWYELSNNITSKGFWTFVPEQKAGLDGVVWSIEAYKPVKDACTLKNHHIVHQWHPSDTAFINMCRLFIDLKDESVDSPESIEDFFRYPGFRIE